MVDFGRAIKRPFEDIKKLLIGTIIQMIPVVNFIGMGYHLNCAKTAMSKDFKLPEWENWSDLFIKGLMMVVAGFVYMIPAGLVIGVGVGASVLSGGFLAAAEGSSAFAPALLGVGASALVGFILGVVAMYLLPSAMLNFAKSGNFGALFALKTVFKKALNVKYLKVWIVVSIYSLIAVVVLSIIPVVGTAIGGFAAAVASYTAFGEVYEKL